MNPWRAETIIFYLSSIHSVYLRAWTHCWSGNTNGYLAAGHLHALASTEVNKNRIWMPLREPVEKAMATHSSTLAWKIPWMEEPGRLQSMGLLRVGHDWVTSLSRFTFMHWRRKWQPTPVFLLENPTDGGAWWAAVYGVAQSRTRLKRLSSSSSSRWAHAWQVWTVSIFLNVATVTHWAHHLGLCEHPNVWSWL